MSAPERVSGFAVLGGRILPELKPAIASRERLASMHGLIAHACHDTKLPAIWAERAHAWLDQLGVSHDIRWYPGDHGISAPMARDLLDWLETLRHARSTRATRRDASLPAVRADRGRA